MLTVMEKKYCENALLEPEGEVGEAGGATAVCNADPRLWN